MKLTKEQIRIKVAELCGLHKCPCGNLFCAGDRDTPNYPEDLNACAEMEATLSYRLYDQNLREISGLSNDEIWRASALQRCLAFLRVHGIEAEIQNGQTT